MTGLGSGENAGAGERAWTAETLPPGLVVLYDQPGGTSLRGLAEILNAYDQWRRDGGRPDPAAPLCCCKCGLMCAACGTGNHSQCPDRDDWDDGGSDDEESDDD